MLIFSAIGTHWPSFRHELCEIKNNVRYIQEDIVKFWQKQ